METRHMHDGMGFTAGASAVAKANRPKRGVTKMHSPADKRKNKRMVKRVKRTAGTGMNFLPGGSED